MIRLAELIKTFLPDLEQKYGSRLLPSHRQALTAIEQCRTQALGSVASHCQDCDRHEVFPLSCGHRCGPQCQHEAGETWLERQRAKLLPVDDYLITFTLPATWRTLVYDHQREAYDLLIRLAWQTLAAFGRRDQALTYLGRYLYRGVLPEKNLLRHADGQVTFRYTDNTGTHQTRTLAGADFLWLLLAHVLPKGCRRSRDYGFLHANGKRLIGLLHRVLRFIPPQPKQRPPRCCQQCGGMVTVSIFPILAHLRSAARPAAAALEMAM